MSRTNAAAQSASPQDHAPGFKRKHLRARGIGRELKDAKSCPHARARPHVKALLASQIRYAAAEELAVVVGRRRAGERSNDRMAFSADARNLAADLAEREHCLGRAKRPETTSRLVAYVRAAASALSSPTAPRGAEYAQGRAVQGARAARRRPVGRGRGSTVERRRTAVAGGRAGLRIFFLRRTWAFFAAKEAASIEGVMRRARRASRRRRLATAAPASTAAARRRRRRSARARTCRTGSRRSGSRRNGGQARR